MKPSREAASACLHCSAASPRATPLRRRPWSLLRSPWPGLAAGGIEGNRGTDERLERARVDLLPLMDVHRAPYVPVEARVEELGRILQRSPLGEGQLHSRLVRFAGAEDPVVRPDGSAHPLPLFHDVRVCVFDELAHPAQSLPAPVPELGDAFVNQRRCRLVLGRTRLFHVLLLKLPLLRNSFWASMLPRSMFLSRSIACLS